MRSAKRPRLSARTLALGLLLALAVPVQAAPWGEVFRRDRVDCSYHYSQEPRAKRFGGFYENQWPGGIVPIRFESGSNAAVRADTLSDAKFEIPFTGARIVTPTGLSPRFGRFDILRVQNSALNDFTDMVITSVSDTTMAGDGRWNIIEVDVPPPGSFWTEDATGSAVVFYTTESVSEENEQRFWDATLRWEAVADVDFIPWSGEIDHVLVKNFDRNRVDSAGRVAGQNILFMDNWWSSRTITHELGHELGAKHEQERPDRETYITVDFDQVDDDKEENFTIDSTMSVYPPTVYDFGSIMHYSQNSFLAPDSTGPSIVVNDPWADDWQELIGELDSLSFWDKKTMSFLYPPSNWRFLDRNTNRATQDGAFLTPFEVFDDAYGDVPSGGRLIVKLPGSYTEPGVYDKAMVIEAPLGGVTFRGN